MAKLFIPVILGTGRRGRNSEPAAQFVHQLVEQAGANTEFVDVRDSARATTLVDWMDNASDTDAWVETASRADGFIIVTPEYNNFFPGELKIFLDQTLKPYRRKPAGLAGVSSGNWGGTRVVEELRVLTSRLGMVPVQPPAYFPNIESLFDDDGKPTNTEFVEHTQPMIDEVLWYAQALKSAREAQ